MPQTREPERRLKTIEELLVDAKSLLQDQFGDADQQATVNLAQALFAVQEREHFLERDERPGEVPYQQ